MKQLCFKKARVAGMPLWLYLVCLVLTLGCMYAGVIPQKMIPALMVLMVLGEGLAALGNTIPVIKTYFGGSVMCGRRRAGDLCGADPPADPRDIERFYQ